MSSCGVNRWGPGTTCEKPKNSESTKELADRISKMQMERAKQDSMWTATEVINMETVKESKESKQSNPTKK
jgi:hypothetical protein